MQKEKIGEEELSNFEKRTNNTNLFKEYQDEDHTKGITDKICHNDSCKSFKELRKIRKRLKSDLTIKKRENSLKNSEIHMNDSSFKIANIDNHELIHSRVLHLLSNPWYKIFYLLISLYILFADDLKLIFADKSLDFTFSVISITVMVLCLIEIFLFKIAFSDDYIWEFFFWLDVISILSISFDLHWVCDSIIEDFSSINRKNLDPLYKRLRVLGRGVRILSRSIKMIRLIKILKNLKLKYKINKQKNETETNNHNLNYLPMIKESKVGQKLEELILKRLTIFIFLLTIAITFFNPTIFYSPKTSMEYGLQVLKDFKQSEQMLNITFEIYINENINSETPIIYAKVYNLEWGDKENTNALRMIEKVEVWDVCEQNSSDQEILIKYPGCFAVFDNRINVKFVSLMNILKTIFILVVIFIGITCFYKDTNSLVIEPLEKITNRINNLSRNPIAAIQEITEDDTKSSHGVYLKKIKKREATLETKVLESTISKISTLLVLGFGEAGAEIISTNMQKAEDGDINPLVPGKKVMAIYGFCDIRCFTDTTEILQEEVMIFVNEVAEIVHEITSDHCGYANKNIGDAFLLVWKFDQNCVENRNDELHLIKNNKTSMIVDLALIAIIKILCAVQTSFKLAKYRKHEAILKKFKNYSVKMGFGLHLGYSIEGAIGSMFKIDASYLSPNVNMASKLEEKTKDYGVHIILSEDIYKHLSNQARNFVRIIDVAKDSNSQNLSKFIFS